MNNAISILKEKKLIGAGTGGIALSEYGVTCNGTGGEEEFVFSCPILKKSDGSLIERSFTEKNGGYEFEGYNVIVKALGNSIRLEGALARMEIQLHGMGRGAVWEQTGGNIYINDVTCSPTFNGIRMELGKQWCGKLTVKSSQPMILTNREQYVTFGGNAFQMFAVLNGAYAEGGGAPLRFQTENTDAYASEITYRSGEAGANLSMDFFCKKMICDTLLNAENAEARPYQDTAQLLQDRACLLTRPDREIVERFRRGGLGRIRLYVPILSGNGESLTAARIRSAWCSFRSLWNDLPPMAFKNQVLREEWGYGVVDYTEMQEYAGYNSCYGYAITAAAEKQPVTISTGDNLSYPQIMRIEKKEDQK